MTARGLMMMDLAGMCNAAMVYPVDIVMVRMRVRMVRLVGFASGR